ncbi:hypothetical protein [Methanoregula sp. UBA64]|jgi:hypothetical protein|uniref:hypothetical protein n=1 Tax=Methanoregula sp. UBA64 TaxID=1915554 RepID=UPI0025E30C86|nr:hypothetical protein [Methanoregula sp. UBA64]
MKPQQNPGIGCISLILLLAIAGVLIAGCTDSSSPGQNGQVSVPPTVTPISGKTKGPLTTVPASPTQDRSGPFIAINPVGEKKIGDVLVISGTTSLPEKTPVYLSWTVNSGGKKSISNKPVLPGVNGTGHFRFVFDTTGFKPGIYTTTVTTGKNGISGSVQFSLTGTYLGTDTPVYYSGATAGSSGAPAITLRPIGDHAQGDVIQITGTTTLREGTLIIYEIYPDYFENAVKRSASSAATPSGISGDTLVIKGTGNTNTWSCAIDTEGYEKTQYIVNVSTMNENGQKSGIFGSAHFTLT